MTRACEKYQENGHLCVRHISFTILMRVFSFRKEATEKKDVPPKKLILHLVEVCVNEIVTCVKDSAVVAVLTSELL